MKKWFKVLLILDTIIAILFVSVRVSLAVPDAVIDCGKDDIFANPPFKTTQCLREAARTCKKAKAILTRDWRTIGQKILADSEQALHDEVPDYFSDFYNITFLGEIQGKNNKGLCQFSIREIGLEGWVVPGMSPKFVKDATKPGDVLCTLKPAVLSDVLNPKHTYGFVSLYPYRAESWQRGCQTRVPLHTIHP